MRKNKQKPISAPIEKKISMQSIADELGIARSTVSFVLNGKERQGRISDELAQKVRQTAERMNYRINELARSLRTGRSNTIALVIADISDVFFGTLAYHLQEYAETKGFAVIILNTGEKKERLKMIFEMLSNRHIDGVIMVPVANIDEHEIERLNPDIPLVFVDRYFKTLKTSRVIINNYDITKIATQLLLGKGCRKLGFISYRESLMHLQDRKRGFIDALTPNNLYDENLICEVEYSSFKYEKILEFLKDRFNNRQLDGIVLATGGITALAGRAMINMGIKLQSDIQIVGFGRIEITAGVSIPYVKQPMNEICKQSFDILLNLIETKENRVVDCVLSASIVSDMY
ncbi:MAG: LacI family transcriptional regulator [Tannerella sp.]|jgi:LacI family transcriptional regulator|nr:LacI family transcriptional regulator [Tannerella sp.]